MMKFDRIVIARMDESMADEVYLFGLFDTPDGIRAEPIYIEEETNEIKACDPDGESWHVEGPNIMDPHEDGCSYIIANNHNEIKIIGTDGEPL